MASQKYPHTLADRVKLPEVFEPSESFDPQQVSSNTPLDLAIAQLLRGVIGIGNLSALQTETKASLVAAINEIVNKGTEPDAVKKTDPLYAEGESEGGLIKLTLSGTYGIPQITLEEFISSGIIPITYADLVFLKCSNTLAEGFTYRITDYQFTHKRYDSAGHSFDILVKALNNHELSSSVQVVSDDEYFQYSNLPSWKVQYLLLPELGFNVSNCPDHFVNLVLTLNNEKEVYTPVSGFPSIYRWEDRLSLSEGKIAVLECVEGSETLYPTELTQIVKKRVNYPYDSEEGEVIEIPQATEISYSSEFRGFITELEDESGNVADYDFKNALKDCSLVEDDGSFYPSSSGDQVSCYTFSKVEPNEGLGGPVVTDCSLPHKENGAITVDAKQNNIKGSDVVFLYSAIDNICENSSVETCNAIQNKFINANVLTRAIQFSEFVRVVGLTLPAVYLNDCKFSYVGSTEIICTADAEVKGLNVSNKLDTTITLTTSDLQADLVIY